MFARGGADLLPLLLQGDDGIGGGAPVGAFGNAFGLDDEVQLLVVVVLLFFLYFGEELFLLFKEFVKSAFETGPDFLVHFGRCGAEGLPNFQQFSELVADFVVIVGVFGGLCRKLFGLLAQDEFGVVVVLLFGEKFVVMLAAALVDLVGSCFETFPKFFLFVVRHGSDLLPLVVEVLKGGEGLVDGFHQHQCFSLFA